MLSRLPSKAELKAMPADQAVDTIARRAIDQLRSLGVSDADIVDAFSVSTPDIDRFYAQQFRALGIDVDAARISERIAKLVSN